MCNTKKEVWLPVKNWEGYYEVSNLGNVRSLGKFGDRKVIYGMLLELRVNKKRHNYVQVKLNNKVKGIKNMPVHRLVAESFLLNPNNLPQVNHKDFNPQNNNVNNLEWCDAKYNNNYSKHRRQNMRGKYGRKIIVYNKDMQKVGEYGSVRDAARALNCFGQNICAVLSGKNKWCKGHTFSDV
jgi:hypothetical protein